MKIKLSKKENQEEYNRFMNEQFAKLNTETSKFLLETMHKITTIQNRCMNKLYRLMESEKDGT